MSALDHKAWHDLGRMRGQAVAIAALVACATAAWVCTALTERAMLRTRDAYYARQHFADAFVALRRAPRAIAPRLAAIPGVAAAEPRVVWPGRLELPGGRAARAVFVSLPDEGPPRLNRLHVRSGRELLPWERGSALLTQGFAEANRIRPGDEIFAVVNGRRERARVVGVALSPEYVYAIGPGMLFPDDRSFAVVWMPLADLGPAAGLDGAFNSASFRFAPGAEGAEVLADVDRVLAPWGGTGAYSRRDQVSNRFLSDEILQLRAMAIVVPGIFLAITAFLLSVIVSRLVAAQRQQIGMLKALGYSDAALALHYAKLVGAVVLAGAAVGVFGGLALGREIARLYADFFRFPFLLYADAPSVLALAVVLSLAAALAGVAGAVRRAARLPPAEAMRPEPPASFRLTRLDRSAAARALGPASRMMLRNLARRPLRALASALGIAMGIAVILVAGALGDALTHLLRLHFDHAHREDATVVFSEVAGRDAAVELRSIAGVRLVEPYRQVPVTLRHRSRTHRTELAGLEPGGALWRLVDVHGHVVPVPPAGVVLSSQLARILDVAPGDAITAQVHDGRRPMLSLHVAALVEDYFGVSAATSLGALNAALGDGELASGALLAADDREMPRVAAQLSDRPRVAGVTSATDVRVSMDELIWRSLGASLAVLGTFALVLSGGVVYNAARVAFAERRRELATLRVLGFTEGEVWRILSGELALLVGVAVPLGWAVGFGLLVLSTRALSSDLFRLPAVVAPATWASAAAAVITLAAILVVAARRWIRRVDLVEVLKARE